MHSSPKLFIFIIQMMALIAIQLELVLGTASSLDSSDKTEISPLKATDINNYEKLTKEALDSDLMDSYDEEKRAQKWNNLQGLHPFPFSIVLFASLSPFPSYCLPH